MFLPFLFPVFCQVFFCLCLQCGLRLWVLRAHHWLEALWGSRLLGVCRLVFLRSASPFTATTTTTNNKRPLTPKSMPPAGDEHAKLNT